jgi:hypothetical protein
MPKTVRPEQLVEDDQGDQHRRHPDEGEADDLAPLGGGAEDADAERRAVPVGDGGNAGQGQGRDDDAGQAGVHVEQQLLQVQEVPRRLGGVRRLVRVGPRRQRRVHQHRERRDDQQEDRRADRLDDDERRPDHHLVLGQVGRPRQRPAADELQQPLPLRLVDRVRGDIGAARELLRDIGHVASGERIGDRR